MKLFYAASTNAFYDPSITAASALPSDAVEITRERHIDLMNAQARGAVISPGPQGLPAALELPKLSRGDHLGFALQGVRRHRASLMSILDGLQVSALCNGDGTAVDIEKTKQALRDITKASFGKEVVDFDAAFSAKLLELAEACPVPAVRKAIESSVSARGA